MRVALDATPLTLSSGGLRRYVEQLSSALAAEYPNDSYTLVSDQSFHLPKNPAHNLRASPLPRTRLERKWWLFGSSLATRRAHAQVFHGTNFEVPYLGLRPSVLTLHDLSPWKDPAWHSNAGRVRSRTPWLLRLGVATMVITCSEAIRREAIEFFNLQPERVVAVPLAATCFTRPPEGAPPAIPYFLFVGTLEPRKNLSMLLDAWRESKKRHSVDLVLVGRQREGFVPVPPEPGLRMLGEVPDEQLSALYAGAAAFVYVSHYEGFGLPVLEAMQCGAVVITSGIAALREVAGDAALHVTDTRELVRCMESLLFDPGAVQAWRQRSLDRATQFSWARTAQRTRAVYEEAIARYL